MLVLRVLPPTGNPNNLFPYQGIWGLEPVSVPGRIGCTYDARASGRPPLVKSVQVRIVRIESIKGKTVRERMAEAVIWTPPQGKDAVEIGQVEIPFQLSLPANVRGMSSMTMFPTARVAYHVEASATLATGRKVTAESRTMHVVRFSKVDMDPSSSGPISWSSSTVFDRVPPFEYSVRIPNRPFTPEDFLNVHVDIRVPRNAPGPVQLKGFELSTKRQVYTLATGTPSGPVESTPFQYESEILAARTARPSTRAARAAAKRAGEPDPFDSLLQQQMQVDIETEPPGLPLWEPNTFPMVINPGESRVGVARLRLCERGFHAWSYGESGENEVFKVAFTLAPKFIVKKGRSSESFKLKPKPIHVCSAEDYPAIPRPLVGASSRSSISSDEVFEPTWPKVAPPPPPSRSASSLCAPGRCDASYNKAPCSASPQFCQRGRRLAEASEASGAPARTRARRDPPLELPPPDGSNGFCDLEGRNTGSSMPETLGPISSSLDTPCEPPSPVPSNRSSHAAVQWHTTTAAAAARHPSRLVRASQRHRPRSAASGRASTFDSSSGASLSNASTASRGTMGSSNNGHSPSLDSRRPRTRSASVSAVAGFSVSPSCSSPTLAANTDGMHGLHLGDEPITFADRSPEVLVREPSPRSQFVALAPLEAAPPQAPPSPEATEGAALPKEALVFRDPFATGTTSQGTLIRADETANMSSVPTIISPEADTTAGRAEVARGRSESSAVPPNSTNGGTKLTHEGFVAGRRSSTPHSTNSALAFGRRASSSPPGSMSSTRKPSVATLLVNLFSRRASKA